MSWDTQDSVHYLGCDPGTTATNDQGTMVVLATREGNFYIKAVYHGTDGTDSNGSTHKQCEPEPDYEHPESPPDLSYLYVQVRRLIDAGAISFPKYNRKSSPRWGRKRWRSIT